MPLLPGVVNLARGKLGEDIDCKFATLMDEAAEVSEEVVVGINLMLGRASLLLVDVE